MTALYNLSDQEQYIFDEEREDCLEATLKIKKLDSMTVDSDSRKFLQKAADKLKKGVRRPQPLLKGKNTFALWIDWSTTGRWWRCTRWGTRGQR